MWPTTRFDDDLDQLGPRIAGKSIRRSKLSQQRGRLGGTLDWWVKDRQVWFGRVRGPDGRQKWVKAANLRPAKQG
jgi:hypothetical protein